MADERTQLLERILASRQFAHADSLKRIVRFICASPAHSEPAQVREHEIAVRAIGRPESFDPKADPIVRVSVASIRERLRSYFETTGVHEPLRLAIAEDGYRAAYTEVPDPPAVPEIAESVMAFWRPYLTGAAPNTLVYSEVLFFRDAEFNYVRNIFVNDLASGQVDIRRKLPEIDFDRFKPSYHFTSSGEMHCVLFLSRLFQDLATRLDIRNSRFCSWSELRGSNLIFVGSSRTHQFVGSLQAGLPFQLTSDSILNRERQPGEHSEYRSYRYLDGKLERVTEFALITRQPGLTPGTSITSITANHGRAIEAAGAYLTQEDALHRMLRRAGGLQTGQVLPPRFQVLLQVELIDFDEHVVSVEYAAHRVF